MAFKVVVRPLALADIDEAARFIAEEGTPLRAGRWREGAFDSIEELLLLAPSDLPILPGEAEVLRVYHGSRRALDPRSLPE